MGNVLIIYIYIHMYIYIYIYVMKGEYKEKRPNIHLLRNILFNGFLVVTANFFGILGAAMKTHKHSEWFRHTFLTILVKQSPPILD